MKIINIAEQLKQMIDDYWEKLVDYERCNVIMLLEWVFLSDVEESSPILTRHCHTDNRDEVKWLSDIVYFYVIL